jgi:pentatricopeptide repeat protein
MVLTLQTPLCVLVFAASAAALVSPVQERAFNTKSLSARRADAVQTLSRPPPAVIYTVQIPIDNVLQLEAVQTTEAAIRQALMSSTPAAPHVVPQPPAASSIRAAKPEQTVITGKQSTLVRQMKELGKRRQWQTVLRRLAAAQAEGLPMNVQLYGAALSAVASEGRWVEAKQLLLRMQADAVQPNVIIYSAVLRAYGRGRQSQRVGGVLQEMKERGVKPDLICYNTAIDAYAKSGQWQPALDLLATMHTAGCPPDVTSYGSAIAGKLHCERIV